jgi:hypothetical protein
MRHASLRHVVAEDPPQQGISILAPYPRVVLNTAVLLTSLCLAGAAQAQGSDWRSFLSVSPVFEEADLDAGGDVSVGGAILRLGTSKVFGDGNRAGVTLNYDYFDYSFDNPTAFGGIAPWSIVQRFGVSAPLSFALRDGWNIGISPSVDWFRENGANTSDALVWGASFSAVKAFAGGNLLGLGVAAFEGIEETRFFPFPIIDWRFGPRWRLMNPLPAGPTGPAGLELDYLFDSGWSVGVGAAWRRTRFRLDDQGPAPNGVGEIAGAPVFLRAHRDFGQTFTLSLYLGAVAGGKMRVEDASGNLLREDDFDLAPIVGANVTLRF